MWFMALYIFKRLFSRAHETLVKHPSIFKRDIIFLQLPLELREWMNDYSPLFYVDVITYPYHKPISIGKSNIDYELNI